jgi:hypothetical protein
MTLKIEPIEDAMSPGCACCGEGGLRGFVYEDEEPHSVYFAESGGMGAKPVVLVGVATGRWASDAPQDERVCAVFACSMEESGLLARPTIPYLLSFPEFKQLGVGIEAEDLPQHAEHPRLRAVLDAIIAQDDRLRHLRSGRARFSAD